MNSRDSDWGQSWLKGFNFRIFNWQDAVAACVNVDSAHFVYFQLFDGFPSRSGVKVTEVEFLFLH